METFLSNLAKELGIESWQIRNFIELRESGATIPFIARYRKEKTGNLSDIDLLEIQKKYDQYLALEERKKAVIGSLLKMELLTVDLQDAINSATTLAEVEDIYLPYKPKRKTKASIAREKGLEPLAKIFMTERPDSIDSLASKYINTSKGINTLDDALSGSRDIMAEWISERQWIRKSIRNQFDRYATISSKLVKGKEEEGQKYSSWFDWSEIAHKAPSHRVLALLRGEKEGVLRIKIEPDKAQVTEYIISRIVKYDYESSKQIELAIADSITRIIFPSIETETRNKLKENADDQAIKIFSDNLHQLLLSPPLGQKRVLAIDPGFRTGCKVVCLDENGKLLHNDTIYPHPPQNESLMAMKKINNMVDSYNIEAIAIGNGTAGRETEILIERIKFNRDIIAVSVNEDGASVYSASAAAREEFPEYDVTVRGAVSIGRRLIDPLSELVKIDPKSIGVGQYQHDVNQKLLKESLNNTVEICVNKVGVDLNTASKELLTYVSGLGPKLAGNVVEYRNTNGSYNDRNELLNVSGLGKKAFEQSAGFLRIKSGKNILDSTAVHPENYQTVRLIAKQLNVSVSDLIGNKSLLKNVSIDKFVSPEVGKLTIADIIDELEKPGRDPRKKFKTFSYNNTIKSINDVKPGMELPGIVTNITAFGAFINLGIKESALLHKSQIANEFVSDPSKYLRINQQIKVKVIEVDIERKRIGLSLKDLDNS